MNIKMHKFETDSDSSEEYFDAEDTTSNRATLSRKSILDLSQLRQECIFSDPAVKIHASSDSDVTPIGGNTPATRNSPSTSLNSCSNTTVTTSTANYMYDRKHGKKLNVFIEPNSLQSINHYGKQRFQELRHCMQNDEDDNIGNILTPDSQNSSVEGVFSNRPTHPFKVVENDAMSVQSMTSLGRVGRILAGSNDPSAFSLDRECFVNNRTGQMSPTDNISIEVNSQNPLLNQNQQLLCDNMGMSQANANMPNLSKAINHKELLADISINNINDSRFPEIDFSNDVILQEPDVIASTKLAHSKTTDSVTSSVPIAPPRRKKRNRKYSSNLIWENLKERDGMCLPFSHNISDNNVRMMQNVRNLQQYKIREDLVREMEEYWFDNPPLSSHDLIPASFVRNILHSLDIMGENALACQLLTTSNTGLHNVPNNSLGLSQALPEASIYSASTGTPSGSISRVSHSLGNSASSVFPNLYVSPLNSAKYRGRTSSIDPTQGLNLHKATQGGYVIKPCDEEYNKAEGPTKEEIERVERLLIDNTRRPKLAGSGSNSLGSATRYPLSMHRYNEDKERRKSAGDEDVLKQMNIYVRTRTSSGKQLSDFEILEQVPVKNLDTGENMPLSEVRPPPVPDGWNPLSLHIMKLTSHLEVIQKESDDDSVIGIPPSIDGQPQDEEEDEIEDNKSLKKKTARIKRFFGSTMRKTVNKAKSFASEMSHGRHKEDVADIVDAMNPEQNIKIKASSTNKGPYEFTKLQHVQDLSGEHTGAVWCMKFSSCGRLLATAGQDKVLRIWVLRDAYQFFQDVRNKYNAEQKSSPTPSQESLVTQQSIDEAADILTSNGPFMSRSFCTYIGHTSDLLDLSWSKNYFILSSSMDKTVRLWHISRKECLCCFQHIDFVTAIAFHPRDDRYFLSGSLDGKLRLWNIPDKKVALWNEVDGQTKLITAANFCQNGQFAVVGSYDGRCIFYNTDQLKYHTQIHVRSTRGKNRIGRKISGIEPMPGEDKILVTSNDSRVRLYDLRDLNLSCKYKGYLNVSSQIKASFSHDGKYIIAGSENQCIYVWKTNHDYMKLSSVRRDRNDFWEGIKAHNATVTCAIFAPHPEGIIKPELDEISNEKLTNNQPDPLLEQHKKGCGYVMISADFNGAIKVFINKTKPKHSSLPYTAIAD